MTCGIAHEPFTSSKGNHGGNPHHTPTRVRPREKLHVCHLCFAAAQIDPDTTNMLGTHRGRGRQGRPLSQFIIANGRATAHECIDDRVDCSRYIITQHPPLAFAPAGAACGGASFDAFTAAGSGVFVSEAAAGSPAGAAGAAGITPPCCFTSCIKASFLLSVANIRQFLCV